MSLESIKEPEIHITLDNTGEVKLEVFNVVGTACEATSKPYDQLFQKMQQTKKSEYHDVVKTSEKQSIKL